MNRDIEFRGKTKDNEWIYGYYHKETSTSIALQEYGINEINTHYIHTVIEHLLFKIEVISETIGQYTGLKDKNGKKIFEGDIVKSKYGVFKSKVEWNDSFCGFFPFCNNDTGIFADECEVIGNIYENKELLEG